MGCESKAYKSYFFFFSKFTTTDAPQLSHDDMMQVEYLGNL